MRQKCLSITVGYLLVAISGVPLVDRLNAQTTVVFPPQTNNAWYYTCMVDDGSGTPAGGCGITLTVAPVSQTNGHFHEGPSGYPTPPHPVSGLCLGTCGTSNPPSATILGYSDYLGNFNFQIATTLVGQSEQIFAASEMAPHNWVFSYTVGYPDLIFASNPGAWTLVGGSETGGNTGHGTNAYDHWMLPATYNALVATANAWATTAKRCMICINDAALPYGGKFDINAIKQYAGANYTPVPGYGNYRPWVSPHSQHDRGSAVDINTSGNEGCQYPVNAAAFLRVCMAPGVGFGGATYSFNEGNHVHCGLALSFPR